jgi:hypothetical protein
MTASIYLHETKQGLIRRGHPWVFPKAIMKHTGQLETGEWVQVFSADGEKIGAGIYNEHSLYRVRMLAYAFESMDAGSLQEWINYRLKQALLLRQKLSLPSETTNAYRLFNSWLLTLGTIYNVSTKWTVRFAGTYNQSPANGRFQISPGDSLVVGFSTGYELMKNLTVDCSYGHAFFKNENINIWTVQNIISGVNQGTQDAFSLKFTLTA